MNFLIADDHAIVRKGIQQILIEEFDAAQVTHASSSKEVFELLNEKVWDVIILDISMPGKNGIEILKQIRSNGIKAPVLILSIHSEEQYAIRALKSGASGFICKVSATEDLLSAIHKVLAGKKHISDSVAERLAEMKFEGCSHEQLSDREMQVLELIASGKTVSEIASSIALSVNTISTYRVRILNKLCLTSNAELTRYALDNGLA